MRINFCLKAVIIISGVLLTVVSSCSREEPPIPLEEANNPIQIKLSVANGDCQFDQEIDDFCNKIGDTYNSITFLESDVTHYTVTLGWSIFEANCFSGTTSVVFLGTLPRGGGPLSVGELMEISIQNHTISDPKVIPEIVLRNDRTDYSSIIIDRTVAAVDFANEGKSDSLSFTIEENESNCTEGLNLLKFDYAFAGYLYSHDLTDSIFIDSAHFIINTPILN